MFDKPPTPPATADDGADAAAAAVGSAADAADAAAAVAVLLLGARAAEVAVSESIAAETRDWKVQESTCPLAAASRNRP